MSGTRQERVNDPAISLAVDQLRLQARLAAGADRNDPIRTEPY